MDEKKYSQLYQALLQEVLQFHSGNQRRIRKGMLSLLLVPLVFLVLLVPVGRLPGDLPAALDHVHVRHCGVSHRRGIHRL